MEVSKFSAVYDRIRLAHNGILMPPLAYQPDDAQITVSALEYLRTAEGMGLRQAIAELPRAGVAPTVAQIAGLRKRFPAAPTHAALALAKLQPKAAGPQGKFPEMAYVWATPEALEQATHAQVARYKAARFAHFGARQVFDLCAGIGGDALALAHHAPVTAVELSPVRAACLRFNALERSLPFPIAVRNEDLTQIIDTLPPDAWVHIDPARRSAGKRSARYADLIPGPEVLQRLFARVRGGAIKLSPAVEFDTLPPSPPAPPSHLELISHNGAVVQALLWIGTGLPPNQRTATVLARGRADWSLTAPPRPVAPGSIGEGITQADAPRHLYELDGAVTRAGLAQVVADTYALTPLTVDGGYLLANAPASPVPATDAPPDSITHVLTPFRVLAIVPFARVAAALRQLPPLPPGPVEVKMRGHLPGIDADQLQYTWTKACTKVCTVLLFRHHEETRAIIAIRP